MNKSIFTVNHSDGTIGRLETLLKYLKMQNYVTEVLEHPFGDYNHRNTILKGKSTLVIPRRARGFANLFEDFLITVKIIRRSSFEVFLGTNNFDTLPAIISRHILRKKIQKIIYYPSDYSEERFKNKFLNQIYYLVENIVVKRADLVVSNSYKAEKIRIQKHGLVKAKSLVIPNPILVNDYLFEQKTIHKDNFVYIGDVSKEHGLSELLRTIHPIVKSVTIIGDGADLEAAINILKTHNIKTDVLGKRKHAHVIKYLKEFQGFGLAPYTDLAKWTRYCSPIKVGEYIACGLPVLMSNITEVSEKVAKKKLGVVYGQLDLAAVKRSIDAFDVADYNMKAESYYQANTPEKLFKKLVAFIES